MLGQPQAEVTVSADGSQRRLSVVDLARVQGVRPVSSVEELAQDDGFSSDAEVDEFIAFVRVMRHADTA